MMTSEAAKARLLKEIRDCIACVRGDSSAPVGDCSTFIDTLIAAVRADTLTHLKASIPDLDEAVAAIDALLREGR